MPHEGLGDFLSHCPFADLNRRPYRSRATISISRLTEFRSMRNPGKPMNQSEATSVAKALLETHGDQAFEMSMPDEAGYHLMRATFEELGRSTDPDGEFFVIKVSPSPAIVNETSVPAFLASRAA